MRLGKKDKYDNDVKGLNTRTNKKSVLGKKYNIGRYDAQNRETRGEKMEGQKRIELEKNQKRKLNRETHEGIKINR